LLEELVVATAAELVTVTLWAAASPAVAARKMAVKRIVGI
jgi:hypothetical protein